MRNARTSLFCWPRSALSGARVSLLAGLVGAWVVGLAPGSASAAPSGGLRVSVLSPEGKGCISAEKLKSEVEKHTRGPARSTAVDVQIEAADGGPGWVADVAVAGRAGHRIVRTPSRSCSKLDEGLVLVVTMLADPVEEEEDSPAPAPSPKAGGDSPEDGGGAPKAGSSWGEEDPEETPDAGPAAKGKKPGATDSDSPNGAEPAGGSWGNRGKGNKGSADKDAADKDAADKDAADKGSADKDPPKKRSGKKGKGAAEESSYKTQVTLSGSVVYSSGLLPTGVPGARVSLSWAPLAHFSLEGAFTYFADLHEDNGDASAPAMRYTETHQGEINTCPVRLDSGPFHLGACAGVAVTHYRHQVFDLSNNWYSDPMMSPGYASNDDYMVSPLVDLRFDVTLFSVVRAGVGVQGLVPVTDIPGRHMDMYTGTSLFGPLASPVIFQGRAGISLVLPP